MGALEAKVRAVELMRIAATFIREHADCETTFYDDAVCDGSCLADDLEYAADDLASKAAKAEGQS